MSKSQQLHLACTCGVVQGVASDITLTSGNRLVCCCNDCQAFIRFLDRDDVLDEFGGTEIYQTTQSQVRIHQGHDQLKSMRLAPKGLLRWYTACCNTPVGNTMNASLPFVGLVHSFLKDDDRESVLGPIAAYSYLSHAKGTPSYPHGSQKFPIGIMLRIIGKIVWWKIRGMNRPSEFFDDDGRPISKPTIAV